MLFYSVREWEMVEILNHSKSMNRNFDAEWTTEKRLRHGRTMRAALALRKKRIEIYNQNPGVSLLRSIPGGTIHAPARPTRKPRYHPTGKIMEATRASWTPEKRTRHAIRVRAAWRRRKQSMLHSRYP